MLYLADDERVMTFDATTAGATSRSGRSARAGQLRGGDCAGFVMGHAEHAEQVDGQLVGGTVDSWRFALRTGQLQDAE